MRKIGILGGTFDPIHEGHIALAEKALVRYGLESVVFIPTGVPPHKDPSSISPRKDRLTMVRLGIKNEPKFSVSKIEINKRGISYAVDTFKKLKKKFGGNTALYYIMGLDSINSILSWKKPIELFKMCEFIVATRPGSKIKTLKRILKFPPIAVNKTKIHMIELNLWVSSSDIRQMVASGKPFEKHVPKKVAGYIRKKGLYLK